MHFPNKRLRMALFLVVLALLAVSCTAEPGAEALVVFNQDEIAPTRLTVEPGVTVTWVNEDTVPHTVTAGTRQSANDLFDFELVPGGEFEFTFEEPGVYEYFCRYHPETAEILVEE